jgi:hypothetical protein
MTERSIARDHDLRQSSNLTRLAAPLLPFLRERTTLDVVVNANESVWVNRLGTGFERAGDFSVRDSVFRPQHAVELDPLLEKAVSLLAQAYEAKGRMTKHRSLSRSIAA